MKRDRSAMKTAFAKLGRIHLIILEIAAVLLLVGSAYLAAALSGNKPAPAVGGASESGLVKGYEHSIASDTDGIVSFSTGGHSSGAFEDEQLLIETDESEVNRSALTSEEEPAPQARCGMLWMSPEKLRENVGQVMLYHRSESTEADVGDELGRFDLDAFFELMETLQNYEWSDCGAFINPFMVNGYRLAPISNDMMIYTDLVFARDEDGRCFVLSSNDQKIVYLPEEDFAAMEKIFRQFE